MDPEEIVTDEMVEIAVEPETPVEAPEPVEAPPAPEISDRERTYRFLAENPDELDRLRPLLGSPQSQPAAAGQSDPRPHPDNFDTYEKYFEAKDAWDDREMERRIAAAVAPITQAVTPLAAAPKVARIVDSIASKSGLEAEGKAYLERALSQIPGNVLDQMTPEDAEFFTNAALGAQMRSTPKPTGRVEPVAGVGPVRVALNTAVVSPSEWKAYLDMRSSMGLPTEGREFLAEMKREGYIK